MKEIGELLHEIRATIMLSNLEKLDEAKKRLLKPESLKQRIYDLCDENNSADIAQKIGKGEKVFQSVVEEQ